MSFKGVGTSCGPNKLRRRSLRLDGYDYAKPDAYFVTTSAQSRGCILGDIVGNEILLNEYGRTCACSTGRVAGRLPTNDRG